MKKHFIRFIYFESQGLTCGYDGGELPRDREILELCHSDQCVYHVTIILHPITP